MEIEPGTCGLLEHPQSVRPCTFGMGHGGECSWAARTERMVVFGGITADEVAQRAAAGSPAAQALMERRFMCHCCGESFRSSKPPDPERDTGYGTCLRCHEMVAQSWVKHGFPGDRPITMEQAKARLAKHA